jgi:hypothetical protein
MMRTLMSINTHAWEPFFTTLGGAVATLAGLLFVSLSLNRDKLTAPENKLMLRLAQRCFADYLYVLVICLIFLIPDQGNHALAIELLLLGVGRTRRLLRHARDTTHDVSRNLFEWKTLREYALHVICSVGLVVISVFIYYGEEIAPYLVAPVAIMLVGNASWNAWLLLVMEKDFAKRA